MFLNRYQNSIFYLAFWQQERNICFPFLCLKYIFRKKTKPDDDDDDDELSLEDRCMQEVRFINSFIGNYFGII